MSTGERSSLGRARGWDLKRSSMGFYGLFGWDHLCSLGTRTSWPTWIGLLVQIAWTVRFTWFLPQRSKMFEDSAAITAKISSVKCWGDGVLPLQLGRHDFRGRCISISYPVDDDCSTQVAWLMSWFYRNFSLQEKAISVENMKSLSHWSVQRASEAGGDSEISKLCWLPTYAVHAVVPASTVAWCAGDSAGVLPRVWLVKFQNFLANVSVPFRLLQVLSRQAREEQGW